MLSNTENQNDAINQTLKQMQIYTKERDILESLPEQNTENQSDPKLNEPD